MYSELHLPRSHLGFEESLPDLRVDARLEPGRNGGPADHHYDEGEAGVVVVTAGEDHHQRHQLHAPADQVQSPLVWRGSHPVDDGKAHQASCDDVAHQQVEILLSKILFDVEPEVGHQVERQAVDQSRPGEEGLLQPPLQEVREDDG